MQRDDILRVQASWQKLQPRATHLAETFYTRLFEFDPWLEKLFMSDRRAGGVDWIGFMDALVVSLDHPGERKLNMRRQAVAAEAWGLREDDIYLIGLALFFALEEELGSGFTSGVRHAWGMLFGELAQELLMLLRAAA